jgi:hypothetical protein
VDICASNQAQRLQFTAKIVEFLEEMSFDPPGTRRKNLNDTR